MVNNPVNLEPAIVIEGPQEDWPGGTQTLRPLRPEREPNRGGTFWFGVEAGNSEIWFRITYEAIHRMQEKAPRARGARLIDAWIAWLQANPDHEATDRNQLRVFVSDHGRYKSRAVATNGLDKSGPRNAHLAQRVANAGFLTNAIMMRREVLIDRSIDGAVVEQRSEDAPARGKLAPQAIDPRAKRLDRVAITFTARHGRRRARRPPGSGRRRVAGGVGEQVAEHLDDTGAVGNHARQVRRLVDGHVVARAAGQERAARRVDERARVGRLGIDRQGAGVDVADVE